MKTSVSLALAASICASVLPVSSASAEGFGATVLKAMGAPAAIVDPLDRSVGPMFSTPIGRPAQPAPAPAPQMAPIPQGMPMGPIGQQVSNRCVLPNGIFAFGPVNPIGMPCGFMTPWGWAQGRVL